MAKPLLSAILRKDKEIRQAKTGFVLVAWLFGIWSFVRLPNLLIFFFDEYSFAEKIAHFTLTVFVIGVTIIAIKRVIDLRQLRSNLAQEPEKYLNVKVAGPPVLTTLIPFLLE